jgi:hypothetical protein
MRGFADQVEVVALNAQMDNPKLLTATGDVAHHLAHERESAPAANVSHLGPQPQRHVDRLRGAQRHSSDMIRRHTDRRCSPDRALLARLRRRGADEPTHEPSSRAVDLWFETTPLVPDIANRSSSPRNYVSMFGAGRS